ncbi:hypothetical protein [Leifsonia poae]|uniref:hypothetical protein n=1 Tax=Leifsonia poae TaxID=110933 RepID=UPI001CBCE76C|nr:hypothetical protein [Leifsonia poae]
MTAPYPNQPSAPSSRAARLSVSFALFIIVANIVLNLVAGAVLSNSPSPLLAWASVIVHLLIVAALFAFSLRYGLAGLRETAGGAMRGRGSAIAGIILASLLLAFTVGSTLLQIAGAFAD